MSSHEVTAFKCGKCKHCTNPRWKKRCLNDNGGKQEDSREPTGLTVRVGTPEATDPGDDSSSDGEPTGATPLSLSLPGDGVSTGDLTVYSSSANCPACKGQHRAHTCSRAKDFAGVAAATAVAPRCNRCKHCLKPRWKKRCLNLPESPNMAGRGARAGGVSPRDTSTAVSGRRAANQTTPRRTPSPKWRALEEGAGEAQASASQRLDQSSGGGGRRPSSPWLASRENSLSPRVLSPHLGAERQKRKEEEERRKQEQEELRQDEAETVRQQKALEVVAERLAKEKAVEEAKQKEVLNKQKEQRAEADDRLQAEQVDEVMRKMQERAMKKRSMTPVKSPLAGPPTPASGPSLMSLDGDSKEKRKAKEDSPDSPDAKRGVAHGSVSGTHALNFQDL